VPAILPRDPIAAELIKTRWLLTHLGQFCGAAYFEMPTQGLVRVWSPSMYHLHGLASGDPVPGVHAYCERFVAPEDRATVQRAFDAALHHPGIEADIDFTILRADGTRRLVRALTQSFALEHGAVELLGVMEDVTDRELRRVEPLAAGGRFAALTRYAVVGEMAAGFAHEMTQPLTALTNYANVAARLASASAPADEKLQRALGGVAEETHRANEIVRRIR
jgi:signal transduction histidine kinase